MATKKKSKKSDDDVTKESKYIYDDGLDFDTEVPIDKKTKKSSEKEASTVESDKLYDIKIKEKTAKKDAESLTPPAPTKLDDRQIVLTHIFRANKYQSLDEIHSATKISKPVVQKLLTKLATAGTVQTHKHHGEFYYSVR